jgi:hypothetical protein
VRKIALGALGWSPSEFWMATPWDFDAAVTGVNEKNGGGSSLTEEQVAELQKMRDEAVNGHNA